MNSIDKKNIKELIKLMEFKPEFEEGGEISISDLLNKDINQLKDLVKAFDDRAQKAGESKVKELVDTIFNKFGDEESNMIVLSAAYVPERTTYELEEPLECINFDGFEHRYNKLYYPIDIQDGEFTDLCNELYSYVFGALEIPIAEEFWSDDNDALNEYWYGVIGIMKDYKIVSFVIRDDGMLCDENGYVSFHNSIIREIK